MDLWEGNYTFVGEYFVQVNLYEQDAINFRLTSLEGVVQSRRIPITSLIMKSLRPITIEKNVIWFEFYTRRLVKIEFY